LFSEVAEFLRGQDIIIGPGRGSAVSSLVAYLLEITSIDPLQHNLLFERFLNEQRKNLPDIDLDVENQEEVFNYLQKKFSPQQVARIITRKKIGWKTATLESAKVCSIKETELKKITLLLSKISSFQDAKLKP
jgi:DNA polymerase-3 subunit alpha